MSSASASAHGRGTKLSLSAAAQAMTEWFRQFARALKTGRTYRPDSEVVVGLREQSANALTRILELHGPLRMRITATEIFLVDEPVVRRTQRAAGEDFIPGKEEDLPFIFYRDGIRGLTLLPGLPRRDFDAVFEALVANLGGPLTHDDMVTLLWQANPTHLLVESVPLEQTIYLSTSRKSGRGSGHAMGQTYAWSPSGEQIHADLGQAQGIQGLHRDTFDDWALPEHDTDVESAWRALGGEAERAREGFRRDWDAEFAPEWIAKVPALLRAILALEPSAESRVALSHAVVTWIAGAMQRVAWKEAQGALELLREFDPDGAISAEELTSALSGLDAADLADRLDEATPEEAATFFALVVGIGKPALDLCWGVIAGAAQKRTRAAACTALSYFCSDDPQMLTRYLRDSRWHVVRNAVFILGQIGGPEVVAMLGSIRYHPDVRVRRAVVQALGATPGESRVSVLISQLDTRDPQLLSSTLNMLTREKNPAVAKAILERIQALDFESRSEENQRALFGALAEVAGEEAVPALEALLIRGGWFARRTFGRTAAARTLRRIDTPKAMAVLEAGLRSRSEAVRAACMDALAQRSRS